MSDRLDDTLRHLARADAPADLSARVRVALETRPATQPQWPKLATAALVGVIAAGGWLVMSRAGGTLVAPTSVREADTSVPADDVQAGGTSVRSGTSAHAGGTSVRAGGTSVPPTTYQPSVRPAADHEHALPSLADIAAVGPAALSTAPMSVEATDIAPLLPIAPMEIPAIDAGEGERR
jgi:hypothetical protein